MSPDNVIAIAEFMLKYDFHRNPPDDRQKEIGEPGSIYIPAGVRGAGKEAIKLFIAHVLRHEPVAVREVRAWRKRMLCVKPASQCSHCGLVVNEHPVDRDAEPVCMRIMCWRQRVFVIPTKPVPPL